MLKNKLSKLYRWLVYIGIKNGIIIGTKGYTRYLILGKARTGTNYLLGLLKSHGQIVTFGEVFWNYKGFGTDLFGYPKTKEILSMLQKQPVRFLEEVVFRKYSPNVSAVGFKIFYNHAQNEEWKVVWNYLKEQTEIRIIHLKRRNYLETLLSTKIAGITNQWILGPGQELNQPRIELNFEECQEYFQETSDQENCYDQFFSSHEKIEVFYENIVDQQERETSRIQQFLRVGCKTLKPRTRKQSNRPLSYAITNYFDLKERFQNTIWKDFFEE